MAHATRSHAERHTGLTDGLANLPILYEDEEEGDMGESNQHVDSDDILRVCVEAHLADRPEYRVFSNMNLYYALKGPRHPKTKSLPYVSPDTMVVRPYSDLGEEVSSYTIGVDGPFPDLAAEILSARSGQQRDLKDKLKLYAMLRVPEYLLVDVAGKYLRQRLLLKRLLPNQKWQDTQDADGGVTSRLGFRVVIDEDGRLRLLDAKTGKRYARPDEAQQEADARREAEERLRALEAELSRLRKTKGTRRQPTMRNGRRKKQ
jgi:Uma2 family endonuclease